jgi:alkylhydroperoxidase/carboxymuconolactone decarboxylase family protein YurZ
MEYAMSTPTTEAEDRLRGVARGNLSGFDALIGMHEGVREATGLDSETFQLVQIAALASVDGCPVSWLAHLEAADEIELSLEKILGTLVAIAPIVGTPRVVSAGARIVHAMGLEEERAKTDFS